jgi:hypothetical protein
MKDRHYQSAYASAKRRRHAPAGGLSSENVFDECVVDRRSQRSIHDFMIKAVDLQFEFASAHFS